MRLLRLYNLLLVHIFDKVWVFSHILPGASKICLRMPAPIEVIKTCYGVLTLALPPLKVLLGLLLQVILGT